MRLLLLLLACATKEPAPDGDVDLRKEYPPPETVGGERPARVVYPKAYDGYEPFPLLFLLGGYSYHAWELDEWMGFSDRVDADGFLLVLPDGSEDSDGWPYWNATDTCCDYDGTGIDDAGYLLGLVSELQDRVAVDPDRIVFAGHSNGGFMAYRMACEPDSPVSAVLSIAGSTWLDEGDCQAYHAVSVLQVHVTEDDVMPYEGDADAPGALEVVERWGTRAGCDLDSWASEAGVRDYVAFDRGPETTVSRYEEGCAAGVEVELWTMEGADLYPQVKPAFATDAVGWALEHPVP